MEKQTKLQDERIGNERQNRGNYPSNPTRRMRRKWQAGLDMEVYGRGSVEGEKRNPADEAGGSLIWTDTTRKMCAEEEVDEEEDEPLRNRRNSYRETISPREEGDATTKVTIG